VKWPRIRRDEALAYTRRILVNARIGRARQASREVPSPSLPEIVGVDIEDVQGQDEIVTMLQSLPERQRKVVVLRYCCDLSERQVADALHISVGTVKFQSSRGLAALRIHPLTTEGDRS
jgi:RNA polymerase sigma factor (sigma-70 family)